MITQHEYEMAVDTIAAYRATALDFIGNTPDGLLGDMLTSVEKERFHELLGELFGETFHRILVEAKQTRDAYEAQQPTDAEEHGTYHPVKGMA